MSNRYLGPVGAEKEMSNPRGWTGRASAGKSTAPTPGANMPRAAKQSVLFPSQGFERPGIYSKATEANLGWPLEKLGITAKVMGAFFPKDGPGHKIRAGCE